ncbi:DEAD/DEAH box helicase [Loktanella sp. SALINAS62]|uniref:DEAD/DEAH box helicase n=1 Tax=Loktanella sp. SALINAS62 TaxID=2706124 RepID=UPI001B8AD0E6|nr:DEAD/DEAH box helicase [Loktanella sp. SALINAS62]MBS1302815.1 DEAD/DEAH box helicase [Loktanella sp. SALINAS62]
MIPTLARALAQQGYDSLTPVQEAVTDPTLVDDDLLVSAQTGSGKTVGFGLAIGPTILAEDGTFGPAGRPLALIVAPTRELAMQVKRELTWLYAPTGAVLASCVGGMDVRDERRALDRGAHIVVATPGRLRDHITRGNIDLSDTRAIVLDEADEMLDLGFKEDLEFILGEAPATRRTLMFSATVPPMIERLAKDYQTDAKRIVTASKEKQHSDIEYRALSVAQHDADNAIINLLRFYEAPNAIVFANTRAMVTRLTTRLSNRGFAVVALSGELSQQERSHALQAMRDGRARVCVATDVAARGIDLPNLELVIHAELPTNAEILLHRSGRTGRAGRKGVSAMIVPPKMLRRAQNLLNWGKLNAEWAKAPSADEILQKDEERLLADEIWSETFTEAETAFAARLLELHSADQIAAAYLRLYQGRQSAPEDLSEAPTPGAPRADRPPREPKEAFGPSKWFRVNVGRDQKAEARWLLPMLCKAGDITKKEIGAIRIQSDETFVEISEPAVAGFLKSVGSDMSLENQAKLEPVDGVPNLGSRGPRPSKRDHDASPQDSKPRADKPRYDKPRDSATPPPSRQEDVAAIAPRKPRAKPERRDYDGAVTPAKPRAKAVWKDKGSSDAPAKKPYAPKGDGKPYQGKSDGKPGYKGKSEGAGYKGKSDGKPGYKGKSEGGAGYKGKSDGAGFKGKSGPAGPKPKPSASDTSKRFTPPGGKPAGPRKGGAAPLKRSGPKKK